MDIDTTVTTTDTSSTDVTITDVTTDCKLINPNGNCDCDEAGSLATNCKVLDRTAEDHAVLCPVCNMPVHTGYVQDL